VSGLARGTICCVDGEPWAADRKKIADTACRRHVNQVPDPQIGEISKRLICYDRSHAMTDDVDVIVGVHLEKSVQAIKKLVRGPVLQRRWGLLIRYGNEVTCWEEHIPLRS
jgi:hypothetical protein